MSEATRRWRRRGTVVFGTTLVIGVLVIVAIRLGAGYVSPPSIGTEGERLTACPDADNCVSSAATDPRHAIAPISCREADAAAVAETLDRELPRTEVVTVVGSYAHLEVRSAVFGFVDDLEVLIADGQLQVRSASRVGQGDLGVNRERVETVRSLLAGSAVCR